MTKATLTETYNKPVSARALTPPVAKEIIEDRWDKLTDELYSTRWEKKAIFKVVDYYFEKAHELDVPWTLWDSLEEIDAWCFSEWLKDTSEMVYPNLTIIADIIKNTRPKKDVM